MHIHSLMLKMPLVATNQNTIWVGLQLVACCDIFIYVLYKYMLVLCERLNGVINQSHREHKTQLKSMFLQVNY